MKKQTLLKRAEAILNRRSKHQRTNYPVFYYVDVLSVIEEAVGRSSMKAIKACDCEICAQSEREEGE